MNFYMPESHIGTLNVHSETTNGTQTLLWSLSNMEFEGWHSGYVPLTSFSGYIIIEGVYGLNSEQTICLDSLLITRDKCSGKCIISLWCMTIAAGISLGR